MERFFLVSGSISGFFSVALGAFAAHSLRARLTLHDMEIFQTGVHYQIVHAVVLLGVAILIRLYPDAGYARAGYAFLAGTVIFSGSLYALVLTQVRMFGAITPIGGVFFLVGWLLLTYGAFRD